MKRDSKNTRNLFFMGEKMSWVLKIDAKPITKVSIYTESVRMGICNNKMGIRHCGFLDVYLDRGNDRYIGCQSLLHRRSSLQT